MGKGAAMLQIHAMLYPTVPCLAVEEDCRCGRVGKEVSKLEGFI